VAAAEADSSEGGRPTILVPTLSCGDTTTDGPCSARRSASAESRGLRRASSNSRNILTKLENHFYGPVAFGTGARSSTLTDWPAGGFGESTGRSGPSFSPGGCLTAASACARRTSSCLPASCPWGRR
jgi:hypothetical protein